MPRRSAITDASDVTFPMPPPSIAEIQSKISKASKARTALQETINAAKREMEVKVATETKQLDDLQQEITILNERLKTERDALFLRLISQPEILDMLAPNHARSCSDENVCNEDRCKRCALIKAVECQYFEFSWSFDISSP